MATAAIVIITVFGLHVVFWAIIAIKAFCEYEETENIKSDL
jgi:hypothetical protein